MTIGKIKYNDTIISLDFETSSIVSLDGTYFYSFSKEKANKYEHYKDNLEKCGIMYLWGMTIDGFFVHGRTFEELKRVFNNLKSKNTNVIYCHNLGFEFQFLLNLITDFSVFARKPRRPMKCFSNEYNIEFRCSYMLTGFSLEKCGEIYSKKRKLIGNLDYSKVRHEKTSISCLEMEYLKNDCEIVHDIVQYHLTEYGDYNRIPLTATGKVRKELKKEISKKIKEKISKQTDTDLEIFSTLNKAFIGGYTHANALFTEITTSDVCSMDIVSSYPSSMLLKKFPCTKFKETDSFISNDSEYCYLLDIEIYDLMAKGSNTFLSFSKCSEIENYRNDNGRVRSASFLKTSITDIDYEIIRRNYTYKKIEFTKILRAKKDYLPNDFTDFIVEMFFKKQAYKGIKEKLEDYRRAKENLNSLYGMCVTNLVRDNVTFDNEWKIDSLKKEEAEELLFKNSIWYKCVSNYSWGVWTTAHARKSLWDMIEILNDDVVYVDTDSVKFVGNHEKDFESFNKKVRIEVEKMKVRKNLRSDLGNIGEYEIDGYYDKFRTLGAKKYCYEKNGELQITVSGVPKKSSKALESIEDFKDGFLFDHVTSNKKELFYNDNQREIFVEDFKGDIDVVLQKYGICMTDTTYLLGITSEYSEMISLIRENSKSTHLSLLDNDYNDLLKE